MIEGANGKGVIGGWPEYGERGRAYQRYTVWLRESSPKPTQLLSPDSALTLFPFCMDDLEWPEPPPKTDDSNVYTSNYCKHKHGPACMIKSVAIGRYWNKDHGRKLALWSGGRA